MRALTVRAHALVLGWRTWRGRATAVRYLDALAAVLRTKGYACILRARPPLLWVLAGGRVLAAIGVHATPGGRWTYREAGRRHLCPCGDAEAAADLVDRILKHRMFPATW
ncbi:hypothetical protein AB0L25_05145 [Spirillospora sp. NPDC052242]